MENSVEESGSGENSKRKRTLDLKSLYESGVPEGDRNKGKLSEENDVEVARKKKRSRKDKPLHELEPLGKKKRKSSKPERENGAGSGSISLSDAHSGLSKKSSSSDGCNGVSFSPDKNGHAIQIPKRPRGFVGRKKQENDRVPKSVRLTNSVECADELNDVLKRPEGDQLPTRLASLSSESSQVDKIPSAVGQVDMIPSAVNPDTMTYQETDADEFKESSRLNSFQHDKEEDSQLLVDTNNSSSRKRQSHKRKRKSSVSGNATSKKEVESDNLCGPCDFLDGGDDDDEVNLEENAARMLSSRFDTSCTGLSSKCKSSRNLSVHECSLISLDNHFVGRESGSLDGPGSDVADIAERILRPRSLNKEKIHSRKRRHFYEIFSKDVDARWILNRKIKVYWPLDESWYYGLVNDYDPERKLHHVKYDDKDEEWIDLQNERFKLLLLPSEVPGKKVRNKFGLCGKHADQGKIELPPHEDSRGGSDSESQPIISWLARSSRQVKISLSGTSKRKKASEPSFSATSPFLSGDNKQQSAIQSKSYGETSVKSKQACPTSSKEGSVIVYVRRRFNKKNEALPSSKECGDASENVSHGALATDNLLWNVDNNGLLRLRIPLMESEQFRFEVCLPALTSFLYLYMEHCRFSDESFLLHHGIIVTMWPEVTLEMLFIDNAVGLRLLVFECSLKQAVVLVFAVLALSNQTPKHWKFSGLHLPATSVRFRLSRTWSPSKQQVFASCSLFSMKSSNWSFLDSKLQPHCLLAEQLPLSECTYDNIKALDCGLRNTGTDHSALELHRRYEFFQQQFPEKSTEFSLPMGLCRESYSIKSGFSSIVKIRGLPQFSLSFSAAPTFFLGLHLKLLMKYSFACISLQNSSSHSAKDSTKDFQSIMDVSVQEDACCESVARSNSEATSVVSCQKLKAGTTSAEVSDVPNSSGDLQIAKHEISASPKEFEKDSIDNSVKSQKCETKDPEQFVASLGQNDSETVTPPALPSCSKLVRMSVEIPSFDHIDSRYDGKDQNCRGVSSLAMDLTDTPDSDGPRWNLNKRKSISSPFGELSPVWPDGETNSAHGGFGNGPKKPRTQVQYMLPFGGYDVGSKHRALNQRSLPYRRIRRANEKKMSDASRIFRTNLELLACDVNVLVTLGDKGWREHGARVILEPDHNEWKLSIKLAGITKYSYKVHSVLQPGSTNRFTHAMMWKGGKDWVLEFTDRSQWMLFKEMHEECYNRNIRAASIKSIPIPGVRLIDENEDYSNERTLCHNSPMYLRQIESDVDMALDPLRIVYDMDSEDEQWLSKNKQSADSDEDRREEISEELFEKAMDMFEKVAYTQKRDDFSCDEVEDLMVGLVSKNLVKLIYDYWQQKRRKKRMPLIRHFQPPLWEKYQQQIKEWELAVLKSNTAASIGCQEKTPQIEKPVMSAFCLKPRGLEAPNRGSKQRSQRRLPISSHYHAVSVDQDGLPAFGRRSNGFALGDEKVSFAGNIHESFEALRSPHVLTRGFSPRDAGAPGYFSLNNESSEWNHYPKLNRNNPKKVGTLLSHNNQQMASMYSQRSAGRRNGVHRWNTGLPEWQSQKHFNSEGSNRPGVAQLDNLDVQEFRLRDASSAAQHALKVAKLKRERAQRMLYRADLAVHKAVVAMMTAEAIKASFENANNDG